MTADNRADGLVAGPGALAAPSAPMGPGATPGPGPVPGTGARFVAALAARDVTSLRDLFSEEVSFRGMTPGRVWEAGTPGEAAEVILGCWFGPGDTVERVEAEAAGMVGDRLSLGYRLRVRNAGGCFLVEQHAFMDITAGKITWMRVLCSGFRPVSGHH